MEKNLGAIRAPAHFGTDLTEKIFMGISEVI